MSRHAFTFIGMSVMVVFAHFIMELAGVPHVGPAAAFFRFCVLLFAALFGGAMVNDFPYEK